MDKIPLDFTPFSKDSAILKHLKWRKSWNQLRSGMGLDQWLPWQTAEISIWSVQFHVFFWGADCTYIYNYSIYNFLGLLGSEVNFTHQKNEAGPKLVCCCCYLCFAVTDIVIHPGKTCSLLLHTFCWFWSSPPLQEVKPDQCLVGWLRLATPLEHLARKGYQARNLNRKIDQVQPPNF